MKITIIGPAYPLRGGIAAFTERLCKAFLEKGHDAEIVTFRVQYPDFLFPGKTQFSEGPAPKGLKIRALLHAYNPFNWLQIGRLIKEEKPDVLILTYWMPFFGPCLGTVARQVKNNKHTRIFALIHNLIPHERRPGDKWLSGYFLKPLQGAVTLSDSVKKDMEEAGCTFPIQVNPHPLYDHYGALMDKGEARRRLGLEENARWLLFFGLVRDYKGLDWLLQAFSKLDRKAMNLKLIVAGEFYNDDAQYHQLITDLGIRDDIVIHDKYIPDAEVNQYFSAADLVVQPYKHATQSGVSQIAYHFEKPMLVTAVGGLPEIVPHGKTGIVAEPNPDAIAKGIEDYFTNYIEGDMLPAIREHKQKYSWEKMVGTFEQLF